MNFLQIKPKVLCSHRFPGLQYAASFEIHLAKKYSSLEEQHFKKNKVERERKKKTEKSCSMSLHLRATR